MKRMIHDTSNKYYVVADVNYVFKGDERQTYQFYFRSSSDSDTGDMEIEEVLKNENMDKYFDMMYEIQKENFEDYTGYNPEVEIKLINLIHLDSDDSIHHIVQLEKKDGVVDYHIIDYSFRGDCYMTMRECYDMKKEITGVKKAVVEYKKLNADSYSDFYGRLMYDEETGEVWTSEIERNHWLCYNSKHILDIGGMMDMMGILINTENVIDFIENDYYDYYELF